MKSAISFRLVAYTDAAGKFSATAPRNGNEDNFYVAADLSQTDSVIVSADTTLPLGSMGMLMVVADGMGGHNAGEVASQIAVDTIRELFTPTHLTSTVTHTATSRQHYLEHAVTLADKAIKRAAAEDKSKEGMGSTIVCAWLYGRELTITWCGDSRAYLFNESAGLRLISEDHSYVQELVNKGLLTYEQTFDHPQNNIITRSLGDTTKAAKADSKTLLVGQGDIILLCSDGLSGVIRDRQVATAQPHDSLEEILRTHSQSMQGCREALWSAAQRAGWYDNVTAILCQITAGPKSQWASMLPQPMPQKTSKRRYIIMCILLALITFVVGVIVGYSLRGCSRPGDNNPVEPQEEVTDTIAKDTVPSKSTTHKEKPGTNAEKMPDKKSASEAPPTIADQVAAQQTETDSTAQKSSNGLTGIKKNGSPSSPKSGKNAPIPPFKDIPKNIDNPNRNSLLPPDNNTIENSIKQPNNE